MFGKLHLAFLTRIFIVFNVFIAIFVAVVLFMANKAYIGVLSGDCVSVGTSVRVLIENDIENYVNFIKTLDTNTEYYITMKKNFEEIKEGTQGKIRFIYTEVKVNEDEMMYILDAEEPGSELFSESGTISLMDDLEKAAYLNVSLTASNSFRNSVSGNQDYGTLLTAFIPIYHNSEFVGLVGVDIDEAQYYQLMMKFYALAIGTVLICIAMTGSITAASSTGVEKLITTDNLTGVYNRAFFIQEFKHQAKISARKKEPLVVFIADIDKFKHINDTYGHPFGDVVLRKLADSIVSLLRKSDCFCRYGGEEFAGLLIGANVKDAERLLNRIRESISEMDIYNEAFDKNVRLTVSFGLCGFEAKHGFTNVIKNADVALYKAKETRNAVVVFEDILGTVKQ